MMEIVRVQKNIMLSLSNIVCLHKVLVICPTLNNPQNGQVMVDDVNNIQGANASYSCNIGFELIGDRMRVCQNTGGSIGVWTGSDPTCQCKHNIITTA